MQPPEQPQPQPRPQARPPAQFPARMLAAVGIGGSWAAVALAETRLGEGSGPWIVPILFVGLLGPWSFMLLLIGLVRLRLISWLAPAMFALGVLIHMLVAAEIFETLSLCTMAAGAVVAAVGILRSVQSTGLPATTTAQP